MSAKIPPSVLRTCLAHGAIALAVGLVLTPRSRADDNKKNPTSKFYVADVDGDAEIDTGDRVDDLNKKSVYNAEGTVVETKPDATNAMVFSNGTGIFFDQDTRVEVKQFDQEPFVPDRTDMDTEPSVSTTAAYLPHGTVGLCTSNLVAGSTMNYQTPLADVNIRGGQLVIQSQNGSTTVSVLSGESTVAGGGTDTGGHVLTEGQQAVVTPGPAGQPPKVTVQPIPSSQRSALAAKVTMACNSKKTVYFATGLGQKPGSQATESAITAFDGNSENSSTTNPAGGSNNNSNQEIIVQPVVPTNPPVDYTVSPAVLTGAASTSP